MSEIPELKPCPFCGGEAEIIEGEDGESAYVQCHRMKMHRAIWFSVGTNLKLYAIAPVVEASARTASMARAA